MKAVTAARLSTACDRLRERLATKPANLDALVRQLVDAPANRRAYLRWINVESGIKVRLVTVEEICYLQADAKYTRVVTADRRSLIRLSLKELLDKLDPGDFWQIRRATIVNVVSRCLCPRHVVLIEVSIKRGYFQYCRRVTAAGDFAVWLLLRSPASTRFDRAAAVQRRAGIEV